MQSRAIRIQPVDAIDLVAITKMTFENMTGVDRYFTYRTRHPLGRWLNYLKVPLDLALAGRGFKAVHAGRIVGCAYVHLRPASAYVFNVMVNQPYRRQGIGMLLMKTIERYARKNGRRWLALHVDDGNKAAQALYSQLGFREYHPGYLRWGSSWPIQKAMTAGIAIRPLTRYQGRGLFEKYLKIEQERGDAWAAPVLADYIYLPTLGGAYWGCDLRNEEVGCAYTAIDRDRMQVMLACRPGYWGHITSSGLIRKLCQYNGHAAKGVDVYLMSSEHQKAAQSGLTDLGYYVLTRSRILMLRSLDDANDQTLSDE